FAIGAADAITQMLTSILGSDGGGNDSNRVFRDRAINMISALVIALVKLRDLGFIQLSVGTLRKYTNDIKLFVALSGEYSEKDPSTGEYRWKPGFDPARMSEEEIEADGLSHSLTERERDALKAFVMSLPGYDPKQPIAIQCKSERSDVARQFGYAQMYWSRAFGDLLETYSHVYAREIDPEFKGAGNIGEVDYQDVVVNRRILVIMLPALEKSPDALRLLGRIGLSALRVAMSVGLGAGVEGWKREVLDARIASAAVPFLIILDEYGYQTTPGFGAVAAQARGLGFPIVFAGQDFAGFKAASQEEAWQVVANTNIKMIGKMEDPNETYELARKLAGKTYAERTSSYGEGRTGASISIQEVDRIDLLDLKKQNSGEWHVIWFDRVIRINGFYANPKAPERLVLNRLVCIAPPRPDEVERLAQLSRISERRRLAAKGGAAIERPGQPPNREQWEKLNDAMGSLPELEMDKGIEVILREFNLAEEAWPPWGGNNEGQGGSEWPPAGDDSSNDDAFDDDGEDDFPPDETEDEDQDDDDETGNDGEGDLWGWEKRGAFSNPFDAFHLPRKRPGETVKMGAPEENASERTIAASSPGDVDLARQAERELAEAYNSSSEEDMAEIDAADSRDEAALAEHGKRWPDEAAPKERKEADDQEFADLIEALQNAMRGGD